MVEARKLSGMSTDDIIEAYIDEGYTIVEAQEFAEKYIANMQYDQTLTKKVLEKLKVSPAELTQEFIDLGKEIGIKLTSKEAKLIATKHIQDLKNIEQLENELIDEETEEFKQIFRIGCDFKGVNEIEEYEDDQIYIPSSYYCLIKCYEKFLKKTIPLIGLNPYGDSLRKIKRHLKNEKINLDKLPSIFRLLNNKIEITNKSKNTNVGSSIFLFKIKAFNYHAVLIKGNKPPNNIYEIIKNKIKIITNKKISDECVKLQLPRIKEFDDSFYVYDIETSSKIDGNKRYQIPEGLGYMKLIKSQPCRKQDVRLCIGYESECFIKMLNQISENDDEPEIKIFAHNGGRFDNIFVKGIKGVEIKEQIKTGGCIRKLTITYNKKTFIFLDSCSFLQASLKNCCKFFDTEMKDEFDIVAKDHKWFLKNKEWKKYMIQDVFVLGQIMERFEDYLNELGESVTTSIGIASVAWRIMCKSCYGISKMYRSKDPTTIKFMKEACYGGRILHYQKKYEAGITKCNGKISKGMISLDGNSLYPSAMFRGAYPLGAHKVFGEISVNDYWNKYVKKGVLSIVEVEVDTNNMRYPLIPYRTDKGCLIYRSGIFTGVYTSVDLEEFFNDNGSILKVIRGIYWLKSGRVFDDLIENLYNQRAELKKRNNGMEYVLKICINSMYGKFLESVHDSYKYNNNNIKITDNITSFTDLKNGQREYKIKFEHEICKKPIHIAAFVLSYARKIMNNLIRKVGPENVYYSDTDSVYIPIEAMEDIELNDKLCGFKNDYGNGIIIRKAIFLDVKRYLLEFNDGTFKAKFNGINFKDKNALKNWNTGTDIESYRKLYDWFYNNPGKTSDLKILQERWTKLETSVVISDEELSFQVNPEWRANWKNDIAYPLYYNDKEEPMTLGRITEFNNSLKISYSLSKFGLKSALPLVYPTMKYNFLSIERNKVNEEFYNSFVIDANNIIYKREKNKKSEFDFYKVNKYGPYIKVDEPQNYTELLLIKNIDNIYPKINKEKSQGIWSSVANYKQQEIQENYLIERQKIKMI